MYPHQAERLTGALEAAGAAALVASTRPNVRYVTGFESVSQEVYDLGVHAVFTPRGTALVVPSIDAATVAADNIEVGVVVCHGEFFSDYAERRGDVGRRVLEWTARPAATPAEALATALDALGVGNGTVALDEGRLSAVAWHGALERLRGHRVVPGAAHLASARAVKGPYEIDRLQRALHVAEEGIDAVLQMLKPGATEREAAALYEAEVIRRGGIPYCTLIMMGERTALPAVRPSDRALRRGDLVRFDLGCIVDGYHSDVARTAVMDEPDERQLRIYDALQAGEESAIDAAAPSVPARQLFETAVATVRGAALAAYRRHHVGHGIGLEPFEPPTLSAADDTRLEPGMVLRIETPYYEHGWGGVNVKDTVLVTTSGARILNRSSRGLVVLD
jgi:Xaa-Pro aminopeptidase